MAHTYATVAALKAFLLDNGGSDLGTDNDARYLAVLEAASRAVDAYCDRSRFGSGFGPRLGTNRYDYPRGRQLDLSDDLLTITSVSTYDAVGGAATSLTDETHYLKVPYDKTPYRALYIHEDSTEQWGTATRGNSIVGKWGYQDERLAATSVVTEALDTSETDVDVTTGTEFSPGHTLLVDSEQLYVTGQSSNTLTVVRAANGTTAATHLINATIGIYRYPREVVDATLRLAQRRWKQRDAGLTGDWGGGAIPASSNRDTERSILLATVGHLRAWSVG